MPKEVIDISECIYRQNNESEYPEYAEGYELISSTHSVGFAVDIHHYQLMPPEFHIA
jgi:D-alanyl-D-alanine dipeptidase